MPEEDHVAVRVLELRKVFRRAGGGSVVAVDRVSLDVAKGEMVVLLGPSGCGKTSMLRCIAGLERPSGGEVWSAGRLLSSGEKGIIVPPEHREFGMMFQSYAVWPHMTVFKNVAYALKVRRRPKSEINERVNGILETVGISHLAKEHPAQLSGGQQQRVALARCLIANPAVILFDEPLSNVDAKVREELRVELLTMQKSVGFAGLYVTHDQEEAMAIADRVVVMHDGNAVQVGTPREVYEHPRSRFVANFVGVTNEWVGKVGGPHRDRDMTSVDTALGECAVPTANVPAGVEVGDEVAISFRPEFVTVSLDAPSAASAMSWRGVLRAQMFRGAYVEYLVDIGSQTVRARATSVQQLPYGSDVHVSVDPEGLRALRTTVSGSAPEAAGKAPMAAGAGGSGS